MIPAISVFSFSSRGTSDLGTGVVAGEDKELVVRGAFCNWLGWELPAGTLRPRWLGIPGEDFSFD